MDETTQALRDELDQALAELEEASSLTEINQTLVDMLEAIRSRKAPVVNVEVNPTPVTVQVSPTPISNVVNVPPAPEYTVRMQNAQYDAHNRLIGMDLIRIPTKAEK